MYQRGGDAGAHSTLNIQHSTFPVHQPTCAFRLAGRFILCNSSCSCCCTLRSSASVLGSLFCCSCCCASGFDFCCCGGCMPLPPRSPLSLFCCIALRRSAISRLRLAA